MKTQAWRMALAVGVLAAFVVGCQSGSQTEQSETPGAAKTESSGSKLARRSTESSRSAATTVTVPAGTTLDVRLVDAIDTGSTSAGSSLEATLAAPLAVNGVEVAPVGSLATGKVTNAVSSGRLSRPAELSLTLTSLAPKGGEKVAITTSTWSAKGESHKKRNAEMIGGGAAAGALIGAIAGGKKGAAIGAGVGAGGGTGAAAYTGKKEIQLAPESKLAFKLSEAITLTVKK